MHRSTMLGYLLLLFVILIVPPPYMPLRAECFQASGHGAVSTDVYVDGRPFWGTHNNHKDAVMQARFVGACVEEYGLSIENVEPTFGWILRWKKAPGYAVVGPLQKRTSHEAIRITWRDLSTGEFHHSPWFAGDIYTMQMVVTSLNQKHHGSFVFGIDVSS